MAAPHPELFHLGRLIFDVTMAKALLAKHGPAEVQEVPISQLLFALTFIGIWPERAAKLPDEALDEPLIGVKRIDEFNGAWRTLLIDGHHRIRAAADRGRQSLTIHVLSREHSALIESEREPKHR